MAHGLRRELRWFKEKFTANRGIGIREVSLMSSLSIQTILT